MKKLFSTLLIVCILFSFAACNDDIPDVPNGYYTLEAVSGWWTKPEDFSGITLLDTFCVDAESSKITSYDEYGNAIGEYDCQCDTSGFTIYMGDILGSVTYTYDGTNLVDSEGAVHYVRCEPINPSDASYKLEDFYGIWYKNGEEDESLVLEESTYSFLIDETPLESGSVTLTKHTTYYDSSEYSGPALSLEDESGFSSTLWITDDGKALYDDLGGDFYISEPLSDGDTSELSEKYALIRDNWYTEGGSNYTLVFKFFGEVWLYTPSDSPNSTCEAVGNFEISDGTVMISYSDGTSEELSISATEFTSKLCDQPFIRHEAW